MILKNKLILKLNQPQDSDIFGADLSAQLIDEVIDNV